MIEAGSARSPLLSCLDVNDLRVQRGTRDLLYTHTISLAELLKFQDIHLFRQNSITMDPIFHNTVLTYQSTSCKAVLDENAGMPKVLTRARWGS